MFLTIFEMPCGFPVVVVLWYINNLLKGRQAQESHKCASTKYEFEMLMNLPNLRPQAIYVVQLLEKYALHSV